jgi:putative nucleotidyltransferase with HDIG domain
VNKITREDFDKVYKSKNHTVNVNSVANIVLNNPQFFSWSGSGYVGQHHYGTNGLAVHTLEVMKIMFSVNETMEYKLNEDIMYLSVLFHDIGKIDDYTYNYGDAMWLPTKHKRNIHHISRSAMIFFKEASDILPDEMTDAILHCILSHHTKREYGSPVAPNSKEAWLLTLADNMSARMNDCETWDYIDKRK